MNKLALFAALLMATSPVAAQSAQQALGAAGTTNNSLLPNTGIYLRGGNDRDVLQRIHRSEQRRLRNKCRGRSDQRRHNHAVTRYPDLFKLSAGRRAV